MRGMSSLSVQQPGIASPEVAAVAVAGVCKLAESGREIALGSPRTAHQCLLGSGG